jgi:hypothetical protein
MMKVLAAEMTDPSRLRRGKQYANDGSVLDIVIQPGMVTCEIQGSRSLPYIAELSVSSGDGMPLRRDVGYACTCPDDDNWEGYACKHVVAALFALGDEFLLEPSLLDVWRGHDVDDRDEASSFDDGRAGVRAPVRRPDGSDGPARRHLRLVGAAPPAPRTRPTPPPVVDPLADALAARAPLPTVADLDRTEPDAPRAADLAAVLRDALGHLRIDWD